MAWFDVAFTVRVLYLVPIVLVLIGWILAVSLVAAAAQVRWRDVGVAMPLIVQVWMFASPVIYPLGVVPDAWRSWYLLNPMAGIINGFRQVLLHGVAPDAGPLRYSALVTAIALPIAYVIFKRAERTMADIV
jgi:lipopolysaccharide transport system permease protein